MSREIAKQQFDYAWSLYQKGVRDGGLYSKTKQFALDNNLPTVYSPPMHCIAEYVRDNSSISREDVLKGMLMAIEFAPANPGLQHHVIRNSAFKAGLTNSPDEAVHHSLIEKAKGKIRTGVLKQTPTESKPYIPERQRRQMNKEKIVNKKTLINKIDTVDKGKRKIKFIQLLKNLAPEMKTKLKQEKEKRRELEKPDFIWHFILQSFSTMGNSRGYLGLILNKDNYNKVTFNALLKLNPKERLERLRNIFYAASLRMSEQKAVWASQNYNLIISMGGLAKVKQMALSKKGTRAKTEFMKQFHGIGDKYARNIWMDVYHPDFHESIAIDERIKQITEALGYSFSSYEEQEKFFLDIAHEASLQGWELDRLMYNFKDHFLSHLK